MANALQVSFGVAKVHYKKMSPYTLKKLIVLQYFFYLLKIRGEKLFSKEHLVVSSIKICWICLRKTKQIHTITTCQTTDWFLYEM